MANTKSAEKAARQATQHRARNVALRSRMRTAIRKVNDAIASRQRRTTPSASYKAAVPLIDTLVNKKHHSSQPGRPAQEPPGRARQSAGLIGASGPFASR